MTTAAVVPRLRWWDRFPKKLTAMVVGIAVQFLPVSEDLKNEVRNIVIGFLGAQGLADLGKGRAVVEKDK